MGSISYFNQRLTEREIVLLFGTPYKPGTCKDADTFLSEVRNGLSLLENLATKDKESVLEALSGLLEYHRMAVFVLLRDRNFEFAPST